MSDKSNSLKQPQGSLGKTIRNYKLELGMTVILIVLYIVLHAVTGTALGKGNVMNVLQSAAPLLIMTMGQLLVVITGGIDLSVGSVYSLSGMVGALVMLSTGSIAAGSLPCRRSCLRRFERPACRKSKDGTVYSNSCNAGRRSFFDQGHLGRQLSDDHAYGIQRI